MLNGWLLITKENPGNLTFLSLLLQPPAYSPNIIIIAYKRRARARARVAAVLSQTG